MVFPGKNDCFISRLTYPGTGTFSLLATSAKVFERLLTMMNTEARQQKSNWDGACLESLSKTELIEMVAKLGSSNKALKRQVENLRSLSKDGYKKPNQRPFDFTSCKNVKIALKIAYLGWDYHGFARQDNTPCTVENEIFAALEKTCLIEDRDKCDYSRCGRTDKGVSAFGQVISLKVRGENDDKIGGTLNYVKMLNRVLPSDIKVLAWASVNDGFDARFSCSSRIYKYFFPAASLDMEAMKAAAEKLIGEHDFRNFCKVDVGNNVNHFIRNIENICICPIPGHNGSEMWEITVQGMAFLWHQVRCMVSVLFLIGLHLEAPEVIEGLLDVNRFPKKPQYAMASEIPLILYDCTFESLKWQFPPGQLAFTTEQFQSTWTDLAVRKAILELVVTDCRKLDCAPHASPETSLLPLLPGHRRKNYTPLLMRPVCGGIDRHLEKQAAKRRRLEDRRDEVKTMDFNQCD